MSRHSNDELGEFSFMNCFFTQCKPIKACKGNNDNNWRNRQEDCQCVHDEVLYKWCHHLSRLVCHCVRLIRKTICISPLVTDQWFRNQHYFCWNRNRNRNQRFQKVLESEPESESENLVLKSELESESEWNQWTSCWNRNRNRNQTFEFSWNRNRNRNRDVPGIVHHCYRHTDTVNGLVIDFCCTNRQTNERTEEWTDATKCFISLFH